MKKEYFTFNRDKIQLKSFYYELILILHTNGLIEPVENIRMEIDTEF